MFDNVRFSGEISLGAFSIAFTQLILAAALYLRQLAIERREEQKYKNGLGRRKTDNLPPADKVDDKGNESK